MCLCSLEWLKDITVCLYHSCVGNLKLGHQIPSPTQCKNLYYSVHNKESPEKLLFFRVLIFFFLFRQLIFKPGQNLLSCSLLFGFGFADIKPVCSFLVNVCTVEDSEQVPLRLHFFKLHCPYSLEQFQPKGSSLKMLHLCHEGMRTRT